ncbi:MAG: orotate phosphoribosyltransferase [Candidatus Bathyarchaeota archaeon]|nr:orotate phosphoribosyltransferase [Candidatus Bathyarchaeota archaeon]
MPTNIDKVAEALYLSGCLKFGTFKIKSGATSPYYIDLARVLSAPEHLCTIADVASEKIKQIMTTDKIDKLASIELKGALIVPSIACRLNLPCIIVRKEDKTYGVTGRIAGADVTNGDNVLFFDDVISEGLSKVEGIKPLQDLGANVKHLLVVVNREHGGKENLEKLGYHVHALAKMSDIANSLYDTKRISKEEAKKVLDYIKSFQNF